MAVSDDDEDVPPLDPKRVAVFVLLLAMIAFAGWRFLRARAAVNAVAEASKDYRKLFPARSEERTEPPVKRVTTTQETVVSGMGMLKIDDDMRAPAPARAQAAEPPPPAPPEAPPAVAVKYDAPAKPQPKAFSQPRLNSGNRSGLNGGAGIGYSGRTMSMNGGSPPAAAQPTKDPAAPAMPDMSALLGVPKK